MTTQFSPQLTRGGIPALEAGLALKHLLTPVAEHVAMPGGRRQPGGIAGEICPKQFHRLELVVDAHLGQWEIHPHHQRPLDVIMQL
jgi:hypothetical protein